MASSPNWLQRYREGQRDQVWAELRELGGAVRRPGLAQEAQLVCDEMARRARHNIESIAARLTRQGYRFHANDDSQTPARPQPGPGSAELAGWLEERFGVVPMMLLSWLRVGGCLAGRNAPAAAGIRFIRPAGDRGGGARYPGASVQDYFEAEFGAWQEHGASGPGGGLLHKGNISGGAPYGIVVPGACADGLFVAYAAMPFVSYLNCVFTQGAGFQNSATGFDLSFYAAR